MMTAIIVDDEKGGRDYLAELVRSHCPQVTITGTADGLETGLAMLQANPPDILFLDIELPGGSGFRLLDLLDEIPFHVIFTTAYSDYAHQAFRYSAIDYLLKPVEVEQLLEAVSKAEQVTGKNDFGQKFEVLMSNLNQKSKKVLLPQSRGYEVVEMDDIRYCQADGNYTLLYFESAKNLLVSKSLKEIEKVLDNGSFFRVHQSFLINLSYVLRFSTGEAGEVELEGGTKVPIARSKKRAFLEAMKNFA